MLPCDASDKPAQPCVTLLLGTPAFHHNHLTLVPISSGLFIIRPAENCHFAPHWLFPCFSHAPFMAFLCTRDSHQPSSVTSLSAILAVDNVTSVMPPSGAHRFPHCPISNRSGHGVVHGSACQPPCGTLPLMRTVAVSSCDLSWHPVVRLRK